MSDLVTVAFFSPFMLERPDWMEVLGLWEYDGRFCLIQAESGMS